MIEAALAISGFIVGAIVFSIYFTRKNKVNQARLSQAEKEIKSIDVSYKKLKDQKELLVKAADDFISKNQNLIQQLEEQKVELQEEQNKNEKLLLNILPEEIVQELKLNGSTKAQLFKSATVLFTDFKGFTVKSEKVNPEELIEELNTYFTEFDKIMSKHGIEKIKTIGDAYMAVGGLPSVNRTHAFDVVSAAIEIKQYMARIKKEKSLKDETFYDIRIGVHSGPVIAGVVGLTKFQYDIWGDTVNTASRMESQGEVGKVNVSQSTHDLIKDQFQFESRGQIEAKGKGLLNMYFVIEDAPVSKAN